MQFLQDPAQHNGDPDRFLFRKRTADLKDFLERIPGNILLDDGQRPLVFIQGIDTRRLFHRMVEQGSVNGRIIDGKNLFDADLSCLTMPDDQDAMCLIQL